MNSSQEIFPVEIFDGNGGEDSLVKSLLENAEIESFVKDSRLGGNAGSLECCWRRRRFGKFSE